MEKVFFVISSVTNAMKAQRLLSNAGIRSELKRSTRRTSEKSCSYTIAIPASKAMESQKLLESHSVKFIIKKE